MSASSGDSSVRDVDEHITLDLHYNVAFNALYLGASASRYAATRVLTFSRIFV